MTSLINIVAIAAFAVLVAAFVAVALRLLIPKEPSPVIPKESQQPSPVETSTWARIRRRLLLIAQIVVVVALLHLAFEAHFAFGAPYGDRVSPSVEVVEVGECRDPEPLGFGLAQKCELRAYRVDVSGLDDPPVFDSIEVVTGDPLEPGDEVAKYTATGWQNLLMLGASGGHWHPVEAEGRPNLVWLPTAVLVAAVAGWNGIARAARRRAAGSAAAEPVT